MRVRNLSREALLVGVCLLALTSGALATAMENAAVRFSTVTDLGATEPPSLRAGKAINRTDVTTGARGAQGRFDHTTRASATHAINSHGDVVGWAEFLPASPSDREHAFLSSGRLVDLGTLTGRSGRSVAFDVNDRKQVVGTSDIAAGGKHAFLWQDGVMTDLGTLPGDTDSEAFAINERGDVVGTSYRRLCGTCPSRAVMWQDGRAIDLNTVMPPATEWRLVEALAIDNDGNIAGRGLLNGATRYFRVQ